MHYFLGCLIQGESAEWYESVGRDISEKFGTWKIHEKIPPHVTLFYPFSSDDLGPVRQTIQNWAMKTSPVAMHLSDFDHFDDRVVFGKVEVDQMLRLQVKELRELLKSLPGMPPEDFPVWHPHVTLMNRVTPEEILKIWNYVQTLPKPNFEVPFDNVTVFRYEGERRWMVEESVAIV